MKTRLGLLVMALMLSLGTADLHAQGILREVGRGVARRAVNRAERKVVNKINQEVDKAVDKAMAKAIGIKSEMKQKVWYGRGIGQVKTEGYSKKGKLMSVNELVEVTGL